MKTQKVPASDAESQGSVPGWQADAQHLLWLHRLAHNVKYFRRIRKLSQNTLAESCGIYRTYLSRIETGKCNPSLTVLVALSSALNVQPHTLLAPLE